MQPYCNANRHMLQVVITAPEKDKKRARRGAEEYLLR